LTLGLHIRLAEADLALGRGDRAAADKIRVELTEEAIARGELVVLRLLERLFGEGPAPR
jgi:hypothetical protein